VLTRRSESKSDRVFRQKVLATAHTISLEKAGEKKVVDSFVERV